MGDNELVESAVAKNAVVHNATNSVVSVGYCDFTGSFNELTHKQVPLNEDAAIAENVPLRHYKVVKGEFVEMLQSEKDIVDAFKEQDDLSNLKDTVQSRAVEDYDDLPTPPPKECTILFVSNGPDAVPCIAISSQGSWHYFNRDGSF